MYTLSVGTIFKNEAHAIKEWLEHYILHGVEHFYMINDGSTDNFMDILQPYIDKNIVTLFHSNWEHIKYRQSLQYNHYILPLAKKETKWLLMIDLDEFVWSPRDINISRLLTQYCNQLAQITVINTIYGSNGHIEQPKSIVAGFTKRAAEEPTISVQGIRKYFVNMSYDVISLNVHSATLNNVPDIDKRWIIISHEWMIMNHYQCQSYDFWRLVKCTRGDADMYRTRTIEDMKEVDINEVEDTRLLEQNKSILLRDGFIIE